MGCLGERPIERLLVHYEIFDEFERNDICDWLAKDDKHQPFSDVTRRFIIRCSMDASDWNRHSVDRVVAKVSVFEDDLELIEEHLVSANQKRRAFAIELYCRASDELLLKRLPSLLTDRKTAVRTGGIEVLHALYQQKRLQDQIQKLLSIHAANTKKLASKEKQALQVLQDQLGEVSITRSDGLGLVKTPPLPPKNAPQNHGTLFLTDAALQCLASLEELWEANKTLEITLNDGAKKPLAEAESYEQPSVQRSDVQASNASYELWPALEAWQRERP